MYKQYVFNLFLEKGHNIRVKIGVLLGNKCRKNENAQMDRQNN